MSDTTTIAWTDSTWNPVRGCTKVSAGCKNCYAERFAERWRGIPGHPFEQGFDVRLVPDALDLPLRWKKPRRVFVNSMSDLFHEDVPFEFIDRVFDVMARARQHTFQVLTKRAERMRRWCDERSRGSRWSLVDNIWLGVSVEDQRAADERIPHLLATPAAVRFLSCEPLLGPVNLDLPRCETHDREFVSADGDTCNECAADGWLGELSYGHWLDPLNGGISWVIVGGESGPGARPCDIEWIRSLVGQCRDAVVPVFVKQLGAVPLPETADMDGRCLWMWRSREPGNLSERLALNLRDRKGGDMDEWPEDLRVREFPEAR